MQSADRRAEPPWLRILLAQRMLERRAANGQRISSSGAQLRLYNFIDLDISVQYVGMLTTRPPHPDIECLYPVRFFRVSCSRTLFFFSTPQRDRDIKVAVSPAAIHPAHAHSLSALPHIAVPVLWLAGFVDAQGQESCGASCQQFSNNRGSLHLHGNDMEFPIHIYATPRK